MYELEKTSLEAHVSLCEMRYQALEIRLTSLENKIEIVNEKIEKFRMDFLKVMIGTAGSIITAIIGAVITIKFH